MKNENTYFYDKQLYQYILQFMAVFSVFKVMTGTRENREAGLIDVPIHYASQDRVVASLVANNTQNSPARVPMFSAYLENIKNAPELRKGVGVESRNTYVPVGGLIQEDAKVVYQRQPVPYLAVFTLGIYVSNIDQHLQIMEQILTLFDPSINLQTSDSVFDRGRLTRVELTNIQMDDLTAQQTTSRVIQSTLTFEVPIYLQIPADVKDNVVQSILIRVGAVDSALDSGEVSSILDQEGFTYTTVADSSDLTFS
jgi:hypothetical protein